MKDNISLGSRNICSSEKIDLLMRGQCQSLANNSNLNLCDPLPGRNSSVTDTELHVILSQGPLIVFLVHLGGFPIPEI